MAHPGSWTGPGATSAGRVEELTRHFDRQASSYDGRLLRLLGNAELAALDKLLPEPCEALDYGCGAGRFTLPLAARGYRITGYDVSRNMIARATERSLGTGIPATFTADRGALQDSTWPLVICMGVLDYYRDPAMLLEEVAPRVAPGGRLIVRAPNLFGPLSWAHSLLFIFSVGMYLFRASDIAKAGEPLGLTAVRTLYALPRVSRIGMSVLVAFEKERSCAGESAHQRLL
jgi:2-polyprenyl-3-methyl-5-hydroxy-6-metoxy-1,4-benzoquinol methylase